MSNLTIIETPSLLEQARNRIKEMDMEDKVNNVVRMLMRQEELRDKKKLIEVELDHIENKLNSLED